MPAIRAGRNGGGPDGQALPPVPRSTPKALLLLTIHGYQIPDTAVPNDFYRQALELDLRGKREYTEAVLSAMGGIKKGHFSAIKALLRLSDEASKLADRHNIEEFKLRYVVALPAEYHAEIVRQIIDPSSCFSNTTFIQLCL